MDRRWGALLAVSLAMFMVLVDVMSVSVALPAIRQGLGASFPQLEFVFEAFLVTVAAFVLGAGHAADLHGRKPVFLLGLVVFLIGSVVGGWAPSAQALIGARAVQGMGAALLLATSSPLLSGVFGRTDGRIPLVVWGTVTGLAVAASPLFGGAVASYLGWRWLFWMNLPIGAVALVSGASCIKEPRTDHAERHSRLTNPDHRPDWPGLVLLTATIAIFVIGLIRTTQTSSSHTGELACFASAVLLVAFVVVESVRAAPMLDVSLFRQRTFTGSAVVSLGFSAAVFGSFMFLVLYLSGDLGLSSVATGARLLVLSGVTVVFLPLTGWLDRHIPLRGLICAGMVLVATGLWFMSRLPPGAKWTALAPGLAVTGVGLEMVNPRLASAAAGSVKPHLATAASRATSTLRYIGTAMAIAVFGWIFATRVRDDIAKGVAGIPQPAGQATRLANLTMEGLPGRAAKSAPLLQGSVLPILQRSLADALHRILLVAAAVAAVSALLALLVRSRDASATAVPSADTRKPEASPHPLLLSRLPLTQPRPTETFRPPAPAGATEPDYEVIWDLPALADQLYIETESGAGPPQADLVDTFADIDAAEPTSLDADPTPLEAVPASTGADPTSPDAVLPSPSPNGQRNPEEWDQPEGDGRPCVRGQVEAIGGEPVPGARITLIDRAGDETACAVTGDDGSFALLDVDEGNYTLVAAAPGYRPVTSGFTFPSDSATTRLRLAAIGSLAGLVVRASDGHPLPASVDLSGPAGVAAQCHLGEDGQFAVPDLLEGSYTVAVRCAGYREETLHVVVRRGTTQQFEAKLIGVGHIYGAVSGSGGGWLPGLTVAISDDWGNTIGTVTTDCAGSYHFALVPEGVYNFSVAGYSAAASPVRVSPGSVVIADLTLRPQVSHRPRF